MAKKQQQRKTKGNRPRKQGRVFDPNRDGADAVVRSIVPSAQSLATYASVLAHPFEGDRGVGVPVWPALSSEKETVIAYGSFGTQANGFGFVIANHSPITSWATGTANVLATSGTGAGTTFSSVSSATILPFSHNGTIAASDYTSLLIETRVVACGLRVRYVGPSDVMAGTMTLCSTPADVTLNGYSTTFVRSYELSRTIPVSRDWSTVVWFPSDRGDLDYAGNADYADSQPQSIGIAINGIASGFFDFEYVLHYEKVGYDGHAGTIQPLADDGVRHVASIVARSDKGAWSDTIAKHAGKPAVLGKKLALDYYQKSQPSLASKIFGFIAKAAPIALKLLL